MMAWRAGDQAGLAVGAAGLWGDAAGGWYALRVAPQREGFVEAWLARRGVQAFHPVMQRQSVVRGRPRVWYRAYLPGYVFARFPGAPVVHRVLALPHVVGALTLRGEDWARIAPADLRALYDMRQVDADLTDARAAQLARQRAARALRPGGGALFRGGPMAGTRCEVVEIRGAGEVRVRLTLFGGEVIASASPSDLVALRKRA